MTNPVTSGAGALVDAGSVVVTHLFGDGHVELSANDRSNIRWDCERNEQLATVCPWRELRASLGRYIARTYAFTSGIGYESQSFRVKLFGECNGCDLKGISVTIADYDQTFFGRKADWKVQAQVMECGLHRPSGCSDCCPRCASLKIRLIVSAGGYIDSSIVTVYGNGTFTIQPA
ncbi:MAG TPA: hypothetical protein VIH11_03285 [Gemmatimonadaceae bacterium]